MTPYQMYPELCLIEKFESCLAPPSLPENSDSITLRSPQASGLNQYIHVQ